MTCDQTQPLLDAFAAHELGWRTAWRVRRHLAACPACAAELAEINRLDSRVRAWRDVPAPAGLQSRVAAALPSDPPVSAPRRPVTARRVAVGLAGMAAATVAFFCLTPGQPGRPTIAFADVEQAMQRVQTVSWEDKYQPLPGHKSGSMRGIFVNWLRRNPPALAEASADVTPSHNLNPLTALSDARGRFLIHQSQHLSGRSMINQDECLIISVPNDPIRQEIENQILSFTQFPQALPSSTSAGRLQAVPSHFQQSSVVVDGQNQVRFDRNVKTTWVWKGHTDHQMAHVTTWADPETHRIIRNEAYISEDTRLNQYFKPYMKVEDHFRYDQTPPKGTFDWSPPAGMKVVRVPAKPARK